MGFNIVVKKFNDTMLLKLLKKTCFNKDTKRFTSNISHLECRYPSKEAHELVCITLFPPSHWLCWCVKRLFHASGNAGCPQRKQIEGTYRDLLVPLNNRTVYQRNKHFLLWNKKTAKREKRQVCNDTVP